MENCTAMTPAPANHVDVCAQLRASPRIWLVTSVAGFIGSNLREALLKLDEAIIGPDNFATGDRRNLDAVTTSVTAQRWARDRMIDGDIRDASTVAEALTGVDFFCIRRRCQNAKMSLASHCHPTP